MLKGALASLALVLGCHAEPPAAAPPTPAPEQPRPIDPAARLSDDVQPTAYALALSIAPERPGFSGRVQIDVQLGRALDSIHLHAKALQLDRVSVTLAGSARPLVASPRQLSDSGLTALDLPESIGPGAARIELDYSASFNAQLRSLYKIEAGGAPYAFTQFEPIYARRGVPVLRRAALQDAVRRHAARALGPDRRSPTRAGQPSRWRSTRACRRSRSRAPRSCPPI